ncbi:hypothetical protein [Rhizobium sp. Leaf341]|uniref:hypothetical protein n=1 Tax=Rhizobium sp. Leaf341 TaxID=1736344 RepID=UPI000A4E6FE6|nr:hypothetical protein [Rhizobium sp. Leaf341]
MVNDERKTERIPVMFEKDLLMRLDDYGFNRRIRSRSATIRQLVRVALEVIEKEKGDATA